MVQLIMVIMLVKVKMLLKLYNLDIGIQKKGSPWMSNCYNAHECIVFIRGVPTISLLVRLQDSSNK